MNKLYIVCVLYNSAIVDISSLKVFLHLVDKYDFVRLQIMDNSSEEIAAKNREASETVYRNKIIYVNDGGNIGISKAYNKALDTIKDDNFYVMWSDDDTRFSMEYMENVIKEVRSGKRAIISGIVRTQKRVISPAKRLIPFSRVPQKMYLQKPGLYRNIYCINSGLTIKSTIFEAVGRYDESLFLDAVDHLFSDKLIIKGLNCIKIVPGMIKQDFSTETNDLESRRIRAKIFTRDWICWWRTIHRHGLFIFSTVFHANGSVIKRTLKKHFGIS